MTRDGAVPWSEDQWATIEGLVQDAARRTRVAASFLPLTGPLPLGQSYVVASELKLSDRNGPLKNELGKGWASGSPEETTYVAGAKTLPLARLAVPIYLKSSEMDDPQLSAARQIFARAAGMIGRLEDAIIFKGLRRDWRDSEIIRYRDHSPINLQPKIYVVQAPEEPIDGFLFASPSAPPIVMQTPIGAASLVNAVAESVTLLEDAGYGGPFACVLGNELYRIGQRVSLADFPASDRIDPYLAGGPFLRSSTLPEKQGVVIALGGEPVDLVIGSDLGVNFLQITREPRYVFSLSETMRLRIKDYTGGLPWRRILNP